MTKHNTIPKPETACTRFSRLALNPASVGDFIGWLCGIEPIISPELEQVSRDVIETMWGWNAPRQRMAKLLWQLVHGNWDEAFFHQNFSYGNSFRTGQTEAILAPIQKRIRWVLEGAFHRQNEDRKIGQGDWGECWWLAETSKGFSSWKL